MTAHASLEPFDPAIRDWFTGAHPAPTSVQSESWPHIAAGRHVLITAPTGSGKTLTAFLWCINRFASGEWQTGRTRVLYISPLKALNNDIRINLTEPLEALRSDHGVAAIRVGIRSGDTTASDRQRLLRSPPDILITTPESLHLLLTTNRGQAALATIECVIVDEIHALVGNRRGAQLSVSLERLADIAGEFQRVALSATVHPLEQVAEWIAGHDADGRRRPVTVVNAGRTKQIEFAVRYPVDPAEAADAGKKIWDPLAPYFRSIIDDNRSTLFFTNSRRLAERITLKINEPGGDPLAFAHHGSLSKEIRVDVEQRLKAGELRAIVATSSLEMGIDIGALDEVVMVQTPLSVSATLQRIGRAGHSVGATSKGTLFPSHSRDLLNAAVLAGAVRDRDIEPIHILRNPLDMLVQIILSMCASAPRDRDALYATISRATTYETLDRTAFDLVLDMLAGRFEGARLRELKPRLIIDHEHNTVTIAKGALYAMYASGGSIPDRGYYQLRTDSGAPIGELDEEFVWEAQLGQTFTFGTQSWTIQRITHNDVIVRAAAPDRHATPFWRSEMVLRGDHLSRRIGDFLKDADAHLEARDETGLRSTLSDLGLDEGGVDGLHGFLKRQREITGAPLPHRQHLLLERAAGGPDGYRGPDAPKQLILHTGWGGALNQPFALALRAGLEAAGEVKPEIFADDDAVAIQCREWPDSQFVLSLVTPDNLDALLRESLEGSGLFGARFREVAQRSLLLSKPRINQRLPLWMSRLQAKKLLTLVKRYPDFPALLETWRTCLADEFDLPALRQRLMELEDGSCLWTEVHTSTPSPFAANIRFDQISPFMYATDDPEDGGASELSGDLIAGAVRDAKLRPDLSPDVIREFETKRQRLAPGYEPGSVDELIEWVKERVALPIAEWDTLLSRSGCQIGRHPDLKQLKRDTREWVVHRDFYPAFQNEQPRPGSPISTRTPSLLQLGIEILSFYGPRERSEFERLLPAVPEELWQDSRLILDVQVEGIAAACCCERDNFEILLRMQRARQRRQIEVQPVQRWPGFMAQLHGLTRPAGTSVDQNRANLIDALSRLSGYSAPVKIWLKDLLAARIEGLDARLMGSVLSEEGFVWRGTGVERVMVSSGAETELFSGAARSTNGSVASAKTSDKEAETQSLIAAFNDPQARYTFSQLRDRHDLSLTEFNRRWWQAVWSGRIAADEWTVLEQANRRGYELTGFDSGPQSMGRRRPRLAPAGWTGSWYPIAEPAAVSALEQFEQARERVRVLLDRYGVLCRELIVREGLAWSPCFRALRIMELAGEVAGGLYFDGLPGAQFASPAAIAQLRTGTARGTWWVNALDPASPCGLGLDWPELPKRTPNTWLAFDGPELILIVQQSGKRLDFQVGTDHPGLPAAGRLLAHLLQREGRMRIDQINDQPSPGSFWLEFLATVGKLTRDHRCAELEPRHA